MKTTARPKTKRKRMGKSPNARSLAWLRSFGWTACIVEQTVPGCFLKRDAFGLADIMCFDGMPGTLYVQATTETHLGDHMRKAEEIAALRTMLERGNRFEIHVFGKRAIAPQPGVKRTKAAAFAYEMRRVEAVLNDNVVTWHEREAVHD